MALGVVQVFERALVALVKLNELAVVVDGGDELVEQRRPGVGAGVAVGERLELSEQPLAELV